MTIGSQSYQYSNQNGLSLDISYSYASETVSQSTTNYVVDLCGYDAFSTGNPIGSTPNCDNEFTFDNDEPIFLSTGLEIVYISICTKSVRVCIANMQLQAFGQHLGLHTSICTQAVSVCIANMQLHNGVLRQESLCANENRAKWYMFSF